MMTMKRVDETRVRFDSAPQLDSIKKAAKLKHWSLNRFLIEAAVEAANLVTTSSSEQMVGRTAKRKTLPLNQ
jgi:uncharacterized protein (DUF1778 family)